MNSEEMHGYTREEYDLLMDATAAVLLASTSADSTGPAAYFEEMTAAGTYLYDARNLYPENRLIAQLQELPATADSVDAEGGKITRDQLLARIGEAARVLRTDQEGMEFREFLFGLAEKIARASRSSWFGPRISEEEAAFLEKLREVLGVEPN